MKQVGIGLAIILVALIGFFFGWSSKLVLTGVSSTTVIQASTVIVTAWLAIWNYRKVKEKEVDSRLFSQKSEAYGKLVELLKKLQVSKKIEFGLQLEEGELARTLLDIQFKSIVWGDQKMISILADMGSAKPNAAPAEAFNTMARLYKQIRRELGHNDKPGIGYDIVALSIIASERSMVMDLKNEALAKGDDV